MSELKFTVGKKYRTRGGEVVECVAVWSKPNSFGFQVTFLDNAEEYFTTRLDGSTYSSGFSVYDIIEQLPDVRTVEGYVAIFPDGMVGSMVYATAEEVQHTAKQLKLELKAVKVTGTYEV